VKAGPIIAVEQLLDFLVWNGRRRTSVVCGHGPDPGLSWGAFFDAIENKMSVIQPSQIVGQAQRLSYQTPRRARPI